MTRTASAVRTTLGVALAAAVLALGSPAARADRVEPPPIYGSYDLFIDFSKQTFDGTPTPMKSMTVPAEFTTHCDVNGCVARMDSADDHARNPGAPPVYEYRWNADRWETSGEYPYFCDRNDPGSAVPARRSDYWIPNPDGSFFGERTLVIGGAGCPGEGPGTHRLPISLKPVD
ncbi:MBOE_33420 family protein [Mycobacterium syngnathidarum]